MRMLDPTVKRIPWIQGKRRSPNRTVAEAKKGMFKNQISDPPGTLRGCKQNLVCTSTKGKEQ